MLSVPPTVKVTAPNGTLGIAEAITLMMLVEYGAVKSVAKVSFLAVSISAAAMNGRTLVTAAAHAPLIRLR